MARLPLIPRSIPCSSILSLPHSGAFQYSLPGVDQHDE
ncbi:hypothetical protein X942_6033 [Burkholderia pseudomallei MSHR5596]|nr:hypothetical protein X942_6033 [Burkholderia pseudomallei MSHR5596]